MTSFRPSKQGSARRRLGIEFDVQANFDSHDHDTFLHFGNRLSLDLHPTRRRKRVQAKIALDKAREAGLSRNRENILQNYFQDLERCYQGERESCKKMSDDMNLAIQAYTMSR